MPTLVPLALLFVGLFVGFAALQRSARDHGLATIDATRYRLQTDSRWLSPAWITQLERLLARVRELSAEDPDGIRALREELDALPFVAQTGVPEVQWPDGLIVPLRLREPVACVPTGARDFLPVAADGTVLGGYAFSPHEAYGGWLPTLGPLGHGGEVAPGDVLEARDLRAGLDIAASLWEHLDVRDLRRLGPIVIDASADEAPVFDRRPGSATPETLPGGVVLSLEGGRRVYFGRPPRPVFDGELPIGLKWQHLRAALERSEAGEAWSLLDVRFDEPVLLTREQVEAFARTGTALGGGAPR